MGRYNPVVRRNILLQNMTSFVAKENQDFDDLQNKLLELDVNLENEDVLQVLSLYDSLVQDTIARANQVRDMLNAFFDETCELGDEDVYLHFPHYELIVEDAPDTEESVGDSVEFEDVSESELESTDEADGDLDELPFGNDTDELDGVDPFEDIEKSDDNVSRETDYLEQQESDNKNDIDTQVDGLDDGFDFNLAFK